jgi:hypothetical protein
VIRGIELMYDKDAHNIGPFALCILCGNLGANTISPIFGDSHGGVEKVKALCDAARLLGLVVGVNADHQRTEGGREWLCKPELVSLLNSYDHVFLECEVETDDALTAKDWVAGAASLVKAVRDAGHASILKVGAPQGGRRIEHPLSAGGEVLLSDPLRQIVFTAQMYWSQTGGWYQSGLGLAPGIAGTKAALGMLSQSNLCFIPGFDFHDDVGETGELELMATAHRLGLSYQHWVLTKDGNLPLNNMIDRFDWSMKMSSITPTGTAIQAVLKAQSVLAKL